MFQIIPFAILFQLCIATPKGQVCVDDKQLKLKSHKYNPDLSMLAYWAGNFSTVSSINQLDTKYNCLVAFTQKQLDSCKQGAWMCIWQKKFKNGKVARNTKVIEPGWSDERPSHCHGGGWGKKDESDVTWKFRYENFNHVVCQDHGFKRGYHTGLTRPDGSYHWSCGCVEDMPQVTRCDCTQPSESSVNKYVKKGCRNLAEFIKKKTGSYPSNPKKGKNLGSFIVKSIPHGPMQAPVNKNQQCKPVYSSKKNGPKKRASKKSTPKISTPKNSPATTDAQVTTEVKSISTNTDAPVDVYAQVDDFEQDTTEVNPDENIDNLDDSGISKETTPKNSPATTDAQVTTEVNSNSTTTDAPVNVYAQVNVFDQDTTEVNPDENIDNLDDSGISSAFQLSCISALFTLGSLMF